MKLYLFCLEYYFRCIIGIETITQNCRLFTDIYFDEVEPIKEASYFKILYNRNSETQLQILEENILFCEKQMKIMKSKGLGDTIEKITTATGVKKAVHLLFGDDCGCDKRKEILNKMFPYKIECLNETEYNYLDSFNWNINSLEPNTQYELLVIYNRVFNLKQPNTSCASCWNNILSQLKVLYNEYKKELE